MKIKHSEQEEEDGINVMKISLEIVQGLYVNSDRQPFHHSWSLKKVFVDRWRLEFRKLIH